MADDGATHEQTLYVCRDGVKVFSIPSVRSADGRVLSAEWRVDACCFTGRLRLLARGDHAEIRLEDANSGDLFAVAPIAPGTRAQVVEPVADSSRNFVLRLADAATGRHAFVGLGFAERPEAFDFNVALGDHDKHVRRARELEEARLKQQGAGSSSAEGATASASASGSASAPSAASAAAESDSVRSAVSALYGAAGRDLSLKEGETIKVAVVKSSGAGGATATAGAEAAATAPGGGGFLARQQAAAVAAGGGGLFGLPPPPGTGLAAPPPAPPAPAAPAPAPPPASSSGDPFAPSASNGGDPSAAASEDKGWATFD